MKQLQDPFFICPCALLNVYAFAGASYMIMELGTTLRNVKSPRIWSSSCFLSLPFCAHMLCPLSEHVLASIVINKSLNCGSSSCRMKKLQVIHLRVSECMVCIDQCIFILEALMLKNWKSKFVGSADILGLIDIQALFSDQIKFCIIVL